MIFHEMYGCYYAAVARAIRAAQHGSLDERTMRKICDTVAFSETALAVIPAIRAGRWQVIDRSWQTPLRHAPTRPLSIAERRWLKAITLDPRFRLFGIEVEGLDGVEPLFRPEDIVYFDRYGDGDPYDDPIYQRHFQTCLAAIREGKQLSVRYETRKGVLRDIVCRPRLIEYSQKDDKFRLIIGTRDDGSVNLQRIRACRIVEHEERNTARGFRGDCAAIEFLLTDERNALERAMLHFAHFQKEAERIDETHYRIKLTYRMSDETELLIRILSFGPYIRVVAPQRFVDLIRDRLLRQKSCLLP